METYSLTNGRTIKMVQDTTPETPRSWDNLTQMLFFGKHKHLGDDCTINADFYRSFSEIKKAIKKQYDYAIIKPVYGYIHSGMTISTTPFSCPWDSGQLGFVIVTKEAIRNEYNIKNVTEKYRKLAEKVLDGEVEVLDQYIRGDVYGFEILDDDENVEDSCWGFFGSDIKTNGILDNISDEDREFVLEQIK